MRIDDPVLDFLAHLLASVQTEGQGQYQPRWWALREDYRERAREFARRSSEEWAAIERHMVHYESERAREGLRECEEEPTREAAPGAPPPPRHRWVVTLRGGRAGKQRRCANCGAIVGTHPVSKRGRWWLAPGSEEWVREPRVMPVCGGGA